MDFDIIFDLLKYLFLTLGFLSSIYLIFTAFELWKFAGTLENGFILLLRYLVFLLPFIYIQIVPSAVMIAVLATYVIKSRRNEIVTWTAAGQSVYRLLFPCFLLMLCLGAVNWLVQEKVLPKSNQIQDGLRARMRNRGIAPGTEGKYWIADNNRIYAFQSNQSKENSQNPSENVKNLTVYEFTNEFSVENLRLQTVYQIPEARWSNGQIVFQSNALKRSLVNGRMQNEMTSGVLAVNDNPFKNISKKPSHLNASETQERWRNSESETEKRTYAVALEKKYTTAVLPFIITLFTAPFALSLSRRRKVAAVGYAVAVWLVFLGLTSYFEQYGLNGFVAPFVAVWSPLFLFTVFGVWLLSKIKT